MCAGSAVELMDWLAWIIRGTDTPDTLPGGCKRDVVDSWRTQSPDLVLEEGELYVGGSLAQGFEVDRLQGFVLTGHEEVSREPQ